MLVHETTENKPSRAQRPFRSDIRIAGPGLSVACLRRLAQNEPREFMAKMQRLIDEGELRWDKLRSLRDLYHATADVEVEAVFDDIGEQRAITASAFPLLAGGMTIAGLNDAYEAVPTIGQELVTEMEDSKRFTIIAAIDVHDPGSEGVAEHEDFPEIIAADRHVAIAHRRDGVRLSITQEAIEENDLAGIAQKVDKTGEIAAERIEEQTLDRVCDHHGSASSPGEPYVYRPLGTGTQLYNSTANNPNEQCPSGTRVTNNALVDYTDLDNARAVLVAMLNERGKRVNLPMSQCILLVPDALLGVAATIRRSMYVPGEENALAMWGPRGEFQPRLVSSPKLDDISTTAWYLGRFPKQFKRKWKFRLEYVTLGGPSTQAYLTKRIAFQSRIAWDCEVGAVDCIYVVQSLSSTTPP